MHAHSKGSLSDGKRGCGGNGILLEHKVMKQFMDIEAVHTYEGTYEVNMLV